MADARNPSAPFEPTIETLRSNQFDSIFDRAVLPPKQGEPDRDEDNLEEDEPLPQREGLPPGFRMRHDSHYVEDLVSRKLAGRVAVGPGAETGGQGGGGRRVHDAGAIAPLSKTCAEIGVSLDAIGACLRLFPATPRPASERVALELMASEVCRATWLLQALSLLDEEMPVANVPLDLGSVASRVKTASRPVGLAAV